MATISSYPVTLAAQSTDLPEQLPWSRQGKAPVGARFPSQGFCRLGERFERVLLVCFYDPAGISTVPETVAFMQAESRYAVTVLNMFEHRVDAGHLRLHSSIDLNVFDALVIHNSVSYNVDNLRSLDRDLACKFSDYTGAKILLKQDENFRFRETAEFVGRAGFDVVFTCLPPESVGLIYPPELVGNVRFERMLTGYVTPTLRRRDPFGQEKTIDIGYRGSIQPTAFGWLAYEKRKIGTDIARLLQGRGLRLDISSRWEDRLGGDAWLDFLSSCKATLGVESGASIFDLDGTLDQQLFALEQRFANIGEETERTEAILRGLQHLESNVHYHQVSPRHFEAAACGAMQLMYPGHYSGILLPGRHFFPLERDYSNLEEALALLFDEPRRRRIAECAFEEVILDEKNWIETFVARVDTALERILMAKGRYRNPNLAIKSASHNVLLIAAHDPVVDPRLAWVEECAPASISVHQLGVIQPGRGTLRREISLRGHMVEAHVRERWNPQTLTRILPLVSASPSGMAGAQELLFLHSALQLKDLEFCEQFGASPSSPRVEHFRAYIQYLLDTAQSLLARATECRGVHAIISTDLDTLPVALILKGLFGVPIMYDAHEYWPEADVDSCEAEKQFWVEMERRLVLHVDHCQTVSPGLAAIMEVQYGVPFGVIPNCEPLGRVGHLATKNPSRIPECVFLFQGNFAPGRGLDLMIAAWANTDPRAMLHLRGPDGPYKTQMVELARSTGLLGTRIQFPEAVAEKDLVQAASRADVGVIPYTPAGTNYRHCCPNKSSQYMAAGIPILANETEFVARLVAAAECGVVCNFNRRDHLIQAVATLCASKADLVAMGSRGQEFFRTRFNWGAVSRPMYASLEHLTSKFAHAEFVMYEQAQARRALAETIAPHKTNQMLEQAEIALASQQQTTEPLGTVEDVEPLSRWGRVRQAALLIWSCLPPASRSALRPTVNHVIRPMARWARHAHAARLRRRRVNQ
jgi:glycosyltransferase involved in cell wall biosynthesis